jgi:hypothetical protein
LLPFAAISSAISASPVCSDLRAALVPEPRLQHLRDRRPALAAERDPRLRTLRLGLVGRPHRPARALLRLAIGGALLSSLGFFAFRDYAWIATVCVVLMLCTAGVVPISEAVLAHHVSHQGQVDIAPLRPGPALGLGRLHRRGHRERLRPRGGRGRRLSVALHRRARGLLFAASGCRRERGGAGEPAAHGALAVLREPVVAWFFAGTFLTVLAHTSLYAFYSLYLASLGYGKGAIGCSGRSASWSRSPGSRSRAAG